MKREHVKYTIFCNDHGNCSFKEKFKHMLLKSISHKKLKKINETQTFFNVTTSIAVLIFTSGQMAHADVYSDVGMLHGAPTYSQLSGYAGSKFTLTAPGDDQALYGLFSVERKDNPCYLAIRSESINNSSVDSGDIKDLCGKKATSSEMGVAYEDSSIHGKRVFVSAIRVCMNKANTRVKGFQIRGRKFDDNMHPIDLEKSEPTSGQAGGSEVALHTITEPQDKRTNCKSWSRWAECPYHNQFATGVIAHFEAGKDPRSLTGIQLQCRYASQLYVVQ